MTDYLVMPGHIGQKNPHKEATDGYHCIDKYDGAADRA
jgi:hypothetical protein